MELHKDLPPLMALRAFEAVARHLSFNKAATELSVTQSAISHQIQKLEQHLGKPLFIRRTRAIDLTEAGSTYYQSIRPALEHIALASQTLRGASPSRLLRIGLLASFGTLWLAPRLTSFLAQNPDITVELDPSIQLSNVAGAQVDLAIRYGSGGWPGVEARCLLRETLFPVCSPHYKNTGNLNGPLLMAHSQHEFEWHAWDKHHHCDSRPFPSVMLHDYNIVVEAAVAGQGIAMGRQSMIARRLEEGSLVPAFDLAPLRGEIGYWLVTPDTQMSEAAHLFSDWLIEQFKP